MRIGFLNNQIDNRGTGNAVFNYAHYNEEILGNKSKIFTLPSENHDKEAVDRYVKRFDHIYLPDSDTLRDVDCLYHIKSGEDDGFRPVSSNIPYLVHAVFNPHFHGDRFAVISQWMTDKFRFAYVPHIVELPNDVSNLRQYLKIPEDATVFGRIGGRDSFDIPWAWEAVLEAVGARSDVYFIFVNTDRPNLTFPTDRVFFFPATLNSHAKRVFINTCDAMLHARSRGETFGIAVGEFALAGKRIITYGLSPEKAHYYHLRGSEIRYRNKEELVTVLLRYQHGDSAHSMYREFTPKRVMARFKGVFLDPPTASWY